MIFSSRSDSPIRSFQNVNVHTTIMFCHYFLLTDSLAYQKYLYEGNKIYVNFEKKMKEFAKSNISKEDLDKLDEMYGVKKDEN